MQKRAKRPAGAPDKALARPVTKVGVVGAGLMACQLALLFARRLEVPVVLTDLDQERVDKGVGYVHGEIDKLLAQGPDRTRARPAKLQGLVTGVARQGRVRRRRLRDRGRLRGARRQAAGLRRGGGGRPAEDCVLATNTSSLSVTEMAAELEHPERVVGFHFFNPVAVMPLLEIVRAERTDDASLATAFAVGKKLKKSCVLVKDAPAFVVNRLLTRFLGEVIRGRSTRAPRSRWPTRALDPLGLPMRPLDAARSWSARRSRCTSPRRCTRRSRTGSASRENLRRVVAAGKTELPAPSDGDGRPGGRRAARRSATRRCTAEQVRDGRSTRWPRRSG